MPNLEERLRTATFPTSRKGLDPSAVSTFLESMANAVAALEEGLRSEGVRVRRLERQLTELQGIGSDPSAVFLSASEAKLKLLEEARSKAEQILSDAREASAVRPEQTDPVARALEEATVIETAARDIAQQIIAEARVQAAQIVSTAGLNAGPEQPRAPESLQQYG